MANPTNKVCPLFQKCGACHYSHEDYEWSLQEKSEMLRQMVGGGYEILPIIAAEDPFYYRNKLNRSFGRDSKGRTLFGSYAEGTHKVIEIPHCLVENKEAQQIAEGIRRLVREFRFHVYDEDLRQGLFRHVQIRSSRKSGKHLVTIVLTEQVLPSKKNFIKAVMALSPNIETVVLNFNDRRGSQVLGTREEKVHGSGMIRDELLNKKFGISSQSFYQINPAQTERLYAEALALADLKGHELVVDAYSGIGTIGILAAEHCAEVLLVESNPQAVRDARNNIAINGLKNVSTVFEDAAVYLQICKLKPDLVFMDPPREGASEDFLHALARLKVPKVVYISCGAESLGRDLRILQELGYTASAIQPVDLFPWTKHVETCVLLSHKNSQASSPSL